MNHKCNDYIIKNNKFIRNFDEMYKDISDPWDQEKSNHNDIKDILIKTKEYIIKPEKVLDIGCATGYVSKIINEFFNQTQYIGTDISNHAIKKAKEKFDSNFLVDDIKIQNPKFINDFDLILCLKTIYYVAPEIDLVIKNIISYLKKDGIFSCLYNFSNNSFSAKWLTPELLSEKLLKNKMIKEVYIKKESKIDDNYYLIFKKC
tara:strand:- start:1692 stop:2303 length:612 start_codon:yes stop_codon:yes gene_type:complete